MVLLSCLCPGITCAADLEFEFGPTLFKQPAVEKPAENDTGFGRRIVIDGSPSYDSPLYEGLWPMTLDAFRGDRRIIRMNFDLTLPKLPISDPRLHEPRRIVPPGMLIALKPAASVQSFTEPSYDHPLYEGLWPMTISAFRRIDMPKDIEVFAFCITANN